MFAKLKLLNVGDKDGVRRVKLQFISTKEGTTWISATADKSEIFSDFECVSERSRNSPLNKQQKLRFKKLKSKRTQLNRKNSTQAKHKFDKSE